MHILEIVVYLSLICDVQCQTPVSRRFGFKLDSGDKATSNDPLTMTLFWEQSRFQCIIYPSDNTQFLWCDTLNTTKTSTCDGTDNPVEYGIQLDMDITAGKDAAGVDIIRIENVYPNNISTSIEVDWFVWTTETTNINITSDYGSVLWVDQEEDKHTMGKIYNKMLVVLNDNYTFDSSILNATGNSTSISMLFWASEFAQCPITNAPTNSPSTNPTNPTNSPITKIPTTNMPTGLPTTNMPTTQKPTGGEGENISGFSTSNNIHLNNVNVGGNGNDIVVIMVIVMLLLCIIMTILFFIFYKKRKQMHDRRLSNNLQNNEMEMVPPGLVEATNDSNNIELKHDTDEDELYQIKGNEITPNGETPGDSQGSPGEDDIVVEAVGEMHEKSAVSVKGGGDHTLHEKGNNITHGNVATHDGISM